MKISIAGAEALSRLLNRKKRRWEIGFDVDLGIVLRDILMWANKLVPSDSGSIYLDDPVLKLDKKAKNRLYFSACFGKGSASLVGSSIHAAYGIAGETYRSGKPYISKDVKGDARFYPRIDEKIGYKTKSIICAPIVIDGSVIGVIELVNKKEGINYGRNDLALLKIFAGYTASVIHNALLAKDFAEISKKDSLTGLYNNRYFFYALEREINNAVTNKGDVFVIFFDLDHFKDVNDRYGHLAGSMVLIEIAELTKEIFLGSNAVLSRFGGDEFVIFLPDSDIHKAMKYAEEIWKKILKSTFLRRRGTGGEPPLNIKGHITCSVGMSSLSRIAAGANIRETADKLIRSADSAMYSAKELGRNMIFVAGGKKVRQPASI